MDHKNFKKELSKLSSEDILYKFRTASNDIKKNKKLILDCLELNPKCFGYIDESLKDDEQLLTTAIKNGYPEAIKLSSKYFNNNNYIIKAIELNEEVYSHLNSDKKENELIIKTIIKKIIQSFLLYFK
jgi:hypothetical protein